MMWLLVGQLSLAAGAVYAQPDWPAHSFRRAVIGADPHNADQMMEQFAEVRECGADTVIFTGQLRGEAWFPSELALFPPTLVVDDAVVEGSRRAKELGMQAVVYIGAPLVQNALADRDDWRQRNAQGEPPSADPACCLLSPFGDWLIEYMCELASHAPLDGIWLDGYPQMPLACACPYCAEAYRADTGAELPQTGDPKALELRRYVLWWHAKCEEHAARMVEAIHSAAPGMAVFANCSVGRSSDSWRHQSEGICRILDSPSVEQFWHVDKQGDPLNPLFAMNMLQAAADGRPTEVFVPLFPHTVDCTTVLPETEILARNLTAIANGSVPQPTYGPGRQELFTNLMRAIEERQPYLDGARRVRYCGIAASGMTGLQYGRDQADKEYWEEVKGWLRALTEAHLPVELLSDYQLDEGRFDGLQVVVLPSTACLSDEAMVQLADFVEGGGGLIATSVASLADGEGELLADFGLAELMGVRFVETKRAEPLPAFSMIEPADHPLAQGEWVDDALWRQWSCIGHRIGAVGLPGRCVFFSAHDDREVAWRYVDGRPAVVTGQVGEGRVVYLGPEAGAGYDRNAYPYLRSLMAGAVSWAARELPPYEVAGPLLLQATFFEQTTPEGGTRHVVHLLNECSSFGRASLPSGAMPLREEVIPLSGVTVTVPADVGRMHLEPGGEDLTPSSLPDGRASVSLPPLGLHRMLVVEPAG